MRSADVLTRGEKTKLTRLARDLVAWATTEGRDFPWRSGNATTYERIVVEVLLQRTTAGAVSAFYERFFAPFPTWEALAEATPGELEVFLKPLGLWRRRAQSLLGLAGFAATAGGTFPSNPEEHAKIPAVGQYVSNAVMLFQHGRSTPLLDVNMARVIERFVRPRRLADIRYDPWLQSAAKWFVRSEDATAANWAILDFAALVCKARRPLCETCPVRARCSYFRAGASRSRSTPPPETPSSRTSGES
jgi:A/G-specific adenine glycosylase